MMDLLYCTIAIHRQNGMQENPTDTFTLQHMATGMVQHGKLF